MTRHVAVVIGCLSLAAAGCTAGRQAKPATKPCPPAVVLPAPDPTPPPPAPGEGEMAEANAALKAGDRPLAAARLEAILAMGSKAPSREEALFTLGVIEALPDNPSRDIGRARLHLRDVIASGESPARAHTAGFILSILQMEEEQTKELNDLRSQITASKGEVEGLRATLARREAELKKIKEILLETTPGS